MLNDIVVTSIVLMIGLAMCIGLARRFPAVEQRYILLSFAAHVAAAFAQIAITVGYYEGGGDMITYMTDGSQLARGMEVDFARFGRYWLDLLLQREGPIGLPLTGVGTSTGSMTAITAALALVFRHSIYGVTVSIAIASFIGKVGLYTAFRAHLPEVHRVRIAVATLLVPSVVFWSCGILKESIAIAGIGVLCYGVHRVLAGAPVRGLVYAGLGAVPVALTKPYILFPLALAAAVWLYTDRLFVAQGRAGTVRIRPVYFVLSAALAVAGVIALGQLYPQYSVDNLGTEVARYQHLGNVVRGGSYYGIGDPAARSLPQQIAFAPLALGTALFRPFVFEANNVLALANSIETTALTIYVVRAFIRTPFARIAQMVMSRPILPMAVVFVFAFGIAVGLATTNFGSLSRYRMPLMPFYIALVLVVGAPGAEAILIRRKVSAPVPSAASRPRRHRLHPRPVVAVRRGGTRG